MFEKLVQNFNLTLHPWSQHKLHECNLSHHSHGTNCMSAKSPRSLTEQTAWVQSHHGHSTNCIMVTAQTAWVQNQIEIISNWWINAAMCMMGLYDVIRIARPLHIKLRSFSNLELAQPQHEYAVSVWPIVYAVAMKTVIMREAFFCWRQYSFFLHYNYLFEVKGHNWSFNKSILTKLIGYWLSMILKDALTNNGTEILFCRDGQKWQMKPKLYLSDDVASGSEITPCNKIDKPV